MRKINIDQPFRTVSRWPAIKSEFKGVPRIKSFPGQNYLHFDDSTRFERFVRIK